MELLTRLEAATSRLEDMAQSEVNPSATTNGLPPAAGTNAAALSKAGSSGLPGSGPKEATQPLPPAIADFDALMNGDVKKFVNMGEDLGGLVAEQVW